MAVNKDQFREAMGRFAASVTVVTAKAADGRLAGLTVTAFSSLSLDPPLALVCIAKSSRSHDLIAESGAFVVNVLSDQQEAVSGRFATSGADPFEGLTCETGVTGAPLLPDTLAAFECRIVDTLPGGDHTIFVGEVEATRIAEGSPLLYFHGGYRTLS